MQFRSLDVNKDGMISANEFQKAFSKTNMPFDQLDLQKISNVGENMINYSEFLAATIDI